MTAREIDGLFLDGDHLEACRYAVRVACATRTRNGRPVTGPLADLRTLLAAPGQADPATTPSPDDYFDTAAAAMQLNCSTRTVRRLAPRLDGIQHGGQWWLPRVAVIQHQEGKYP